MVIIATALHCAEVRDVTHVGFDGVTVRKDEARVVAWSPEDGLYHLKNDEKWFGYTFGCRDYYSNDDRDIQTNNRLQVRCTAGHRPNCPYAQSSLS